MRTTTEPTRQIDDDTTLTFEQGHAWVSQAKFMTKAHHVELAPDSARKLSCLLAEWADRVDPPKPTPEPTSAEWIIQLEPGKWYAKSRMGSWATEKKEQARRYKTKQGAHIGLGHAKKFMDCDFPRL